MSCGPIREPDRPHRLETAHAPNSILDERMVRRIQQRLDQVIEERSVFSADKHLDGHPGMEVVSGNSIRQAPRYLQESLVIGLLRCLIHKPVS